MLKKLLLILVLVLLVAPASMAQKRHGGGHKRPNSQRPNAQGADVQGSDTQGSDAQGSKSQGQGPRQQQVTFEHKADFSAITVGTGSPVLDWNRAGACVLIHNGDDYVLVDMGRYAQLRLQQMGVPLAKVDALLFTHHHMDHNESFVPIFLKARQQGGAGLVAGPPGTVKLSEFVLEFYEEDIRYRLGNRSGDVDRAWQRFATFERRDLDGGERFEVAGMQVSTAKVNHSIHTNALRFDLGEKSIVVSGDLTYSESLVQLARGADVLIMDGSGVGRTGKNKAGKGKSGSAHGSQDEIIRMASEADVHTLVLTHFGPRKLDEQAVATAIKKRFKGEVIFATDMLEVAP